MPDRKDATSLGRWARLLRRLRSRRFRVAERSMAPALVPGDCLYVDTGAYRSQGPARGDLVVTRDPLVPSRHLVKRVAFLANEPGPAGGPTTIPVATVYLLGDDPTSSRDSRQFGPVPLNLLIGRVYRCYNPPERRRTL